MHPDDKQNQADIITCLENEIKSYRAQEQALLHLRAVLNENSFDMGLTFAKKLGDQITSEQNNARSMLLASIQQKASFQ